MFLDTSGLLCLHNKAEPQHVFAKSLFQKRRHKVTTSYVLSELVTLAFVRGIARARTLAFVRKLIKSGTTTVVWVDEALHLRAMDLLERRMDKEYSLCDAASFVLMRDQQVAEALSTDHHFEQEGFIRLLPESGPPIP